MDRKAEKQKERQKEVDTVILKKTKSKIKEDLRL